jgi:hypothetical protein
MESCGIVDNNFDPPRGAVGEEFDPDCTLDFDELQEEYEELFGWEEGKFRPALRPGAYLDFLLYEESQFEWSSGRYERTPKTVFKKILPCIDLDDVHYCDYTWYDGVEAPSCY